jgi:hypothetical protein
MTRSEQLRTAGSQVAVVRPRARKVEDRLHRAGLLFCGNLQSRFPGQRADVVLAGSELLWKRPSKLCWG